MQLQGSLYCNTGKFEGTLQARYKPTLGIIIQQEENRGKAGPFKPSLPCGHGWTCDVKQAGRGRLVEAKDLGFEAVIGKESNRALRAKRDFIISEKYGQRTYASKMLCWNTTRPIHLPRFMAAFACDHGCGRGCYDWQSLRCFLFCS